MISLPQSVATAESRARRAGQAPRPCDHTGYRGRSQWRRHDTGEASYHAQIVLTLHANPPGLDHPRGSASCIHAAMASLLSRAAFMHYHDKAKARAFKSLYHYSTYPNTFMVYCLYIDRDGFEDSSSDAILSSFSLQILFQESNKSDVLIFPIVCFTSICLSNSDPPKKYNSIHFKFYIIYSLQYWFLSTAHFVISRKGKPNDQHYNSYFGYH